MGAPVRVLHHTDPAEKIWEDLGWVIDGLTPTGADVLLVMYERVGQGESKTAGGIIIPDTKGGAATEDKYQGKVGLVVKMGPLAFQEDETHKWGNVIPKVGDWVLINVNEAFSFDVPVYRKSAQRVGSPEGQRRMRLVQDVYARIIASPQVFDAIW
jgi:co-chaperonin GroES (HSP10)